PPDPARRLYQREEGGDHRDPPVGRGVPAGTGNCRDRQERRAQDRNENRSHSHVEQRSHDRRRTSRGRRGGSGYANASNMRSSISRNAYQRDPPRYVFASETTPTPESGRKNIRVLSP